MAIKLQRSLHLCHRPRGMLRARFASPWHRVCVTRGVAKDQRLSHTRLVADLKAFVLLREPYSIVRQGEASRR